MTRGAILVRLNAWRRSAAALIAGALGSRLSRRAWRYGCLSIVFALFAAVALNGFYQKWGLRDSDAAWDKDLRYSFVLMVDGDAFKPFVYRQLLPKAANAFDAALSQEARAWLLERLQDSAWWEVRSLTQQMRLAPVLHERYLVRYYFVYYACFAFMFAALFVLREIGRDLGFGDAASSAGACLFALAFVYFMSMGGFFYDFPEVFFMALAFLLALRGRWLWLAPVAVLATYNKEVFGVFLLTLYPLLAARMPALRAAAMVAALVAISGLTHILGRLEFIDNPGATESWFADSLRFYGNWRNLIAFEVNFGVVTPRAYSLFTLVVIVGLVVGAWRRLSPPVRQHALAALGVTVPLVLLFCGPGETRNYSLCFVTLFILIAQNLSSWMTHARMREQAS